MYDALKIVYANQTESEKLADATMHDNGIGFGGADAEFGSSLAKQVLAGRALTIPANWRA